MTTARTVPGPWSVLVTQASALRLERPPGLPLAHPTGPTLPLAALAHQEDAGHGQVSACLWALSSADRALVAGRLRQLAAMLDGQEGGQDHA